MLIMRDVLNEHVFREKIWQNSKYDKANATVIHAVDLIYCLRKAYFRLKKLSLQIM